MQTIVELNVEQRQNKTLNLQQLGEFYKKIRGQWVLLEILENDQRNKPVKFKVLAVHQDKKKLYDFLLEDEKWDWRHHYVIVLADPDNCTI